MMAHFQHTVLAREGADEVKSEVIFLQKKQYFDLCFYNQVDYFYLIVYDDFFPENTRNAVRAATHLREVV